jgi:hypothetical protein
VPSLHLPITKANRLQRLHQFIDLSPDERWLLLESAVLMPLVAVALKLFGYKRVQGFLAARFTASRKKTTSLAAVERVAEIVGIVPKRLFTRAVCLERALTLWAMLRQHGIEPTLCIGASKADGKFAAHAWVEYAGTVLNDSRYIREHYAVLTEVNFPINQFTD